MYLDPIRAEQHRIADTDWAQGWRYGLREAIDKALEGERDGAERTIATIHVKKRGDTSFHDYMVDLGNP